MTSENEVPIKIRHYSVDEMWHRRPAIFWKPLTLLTFAALILALPFILVLMVLLNFWGWLTGYSDEWSLDEVEKYLRSVNNTKDETQLSSLMDDVDCLFLYTTQSDPFLESVRVRWLKSTEDSGWGGPDGFVDREDLRLILEDVQSYQREQQVS